MKIKLARIFVILSIVTCCLETNIFAEKALALGDGVYTIKTKTSYANPETGKIEDGGTANADLGESMSRNVIGQTALLEVQNGRYFITLRLALASNCNNIRFYVEPSKGSNSFYETGNENTASDSTNDTRDYRFEVKDPNTIISPVMYVVPMGRDVKFYAYLDIASAVSGKSDFVSKIDINNNSVNNGISNIPASNESEVSSSSIAENNSQTSGEESETSQEALQTESDRPKNTVVSADDLLAEAKGIEEYKAVKTEKKESSNDKVKPIVGIGIIGVIALGLYGFYIKKMRK